MKKSTMIAALFAASTFAACAADVYSSNIVGYSKIDLVPGLTMVGAPFQAVGSTTGSINIQDVVDTTGLIGYDWDLGAPNDQLIIWDAVAQGYLTTYSWSDADPYDLGALNKWIDDDLAPADVDIPVGSAFFISSASTTDFVGTLKGEVPSAAAGQDIAFVTGLTMIANPFPYALDVNANMASTGLIGFDWDLGVPNDQLIIWDPAAQGYLTTYSWSDADPYEMGTLNKWIDDDLAPATAVVPVGGAFFINSSGAGGTIDFAAP